MILHIILHILLQAEGFAFIALAGEFSAIPMLVATDVRGYTFPLHKGNHRYVAHSQNHLPGARS